MKNWEKRIQAVLGSDYQRNRANAHRYLTCLKKHLRFPVPVTGIEDFPWEEPYVFGGWDQQEYEELKQTNPSYTEKFDLLEILKPELSAQDSLSEDWPVSEV